MAFQQQKGVLLTSFSNEPNTQQIHRNLFTTWKKIRSKGRFNGIRLSLHSAKHRSKQGCELDFALQLSCNETRTQRLVQMGEWKKKGLRGFSESWTLNKLAICTRKYAQAVLETVLYTAN